MAMTSITVLLLLLLPLILLFPSSSIANPFDSKSANPFDTSSASLNSSSSICAPGSFICQGHCIPADWVGDGEADCENGADEQQQGDGEEGGGGGNDADEGGKTTTTMEAEEATTESADPFSTATSPPAQTLDHWLAQLEEQMPDFYDRPLQSGRLLLDGCSSSSLFRPSSSSAASSPTSIGPWSRLQMFLCELLGPALRDQPDCLSATPNCPTTMGGNSSSSPSLACSLLAQSSSHFQCLEAQPPAECAESALEMLAPLRQESEHWAEELECSAAAIDAAVLVDVPSSATATTEESTASSASITDSSPSPASSPPPPYAGDALALLENAERMCQADEERAAGDPAEPIWAKVCDRVDVLAQNAACLAELRRREGRKCAQEKSVNASTCALLEGFGQTVDCALRSLNEVCPVEAQEAVVGIQEQLNDEAIARQCFQQKEEAEEGEGKKEGEKGKAATAQQTIGPSTSGAGQFSLRPTHGPCTGDQEETALLCLAELADLPARLQRLPSLGSLLSNQSALGPVCALFDRYDGCLGTRVFGGGGGERCALNSPLNALARVGLAPICAVQLRRTISSSSNQTTTTNNATASPPVCLASPAMVQCQAPVEALGRAVGAILQGASNPAAHLCKAFYSLRHAFQCGKMAAETMVDNNSSDGNAGECPKEALIGRMVALQAMLDSIGREEGCPEEAPAHLDSLLRLLPSRPPSIPLARPLPADALPPMSAVICPKLQQDQFQACVQPLSAFQPHPLAVIKQPRQIVDACRAFANFTQCHLALAAPQCVPLWARGMSGMFEFACGPHGNPLFLEIRQCLRRATTRPDVRQCVLSFSHASPHDACPSSGQLLACAVPPIEEKCGPKAGQFVRHYVGRFATALVPNCSLEMGGGGDGPPPSPSVMVEGDGPPKSPIFLGPNCSSAHTQLVQQCAAPLNQLRAQLDALFSGGLQSLMKNLNGLGALFQQGCSLASQFRTCLGPILSSSSNCTISSCLLAAGAGICDQPDIGAAIDSNLGCVFRQVSNPAFGQCIRANLGPLRQLNLSALRAALPQFVDCVQPIVLDQCGPTPLNVLRVFASKPDQCPLNAQSPAGIQVPPATCLPHLRQSRLDCQRRFLLAKYQFVPGPLLRLIDQQNNNANADDGQQLAAQFCADLEKVQLCERETRPCDAEEPYGRTRAMRALGTAICSSRAEFGRHSRCLAQIGHSIAGMACRMPSPFDGASEMPSETDQFCGAVNASSQCLAPQIFAACGADALDFAFSAGNEYLAQIVPGGKCQLEAPALTLQTGCTEPQLIAYLECESGLDRFRPRPIALIANQSDWDQFCAAAQRQYRPCVEKLDCRPEPATGASLALYETVCEREIARRDQRLFGPCLLGVTEKGDGRDCVDQFRRVDLLAKDAGPKVCAGVDRLLQCLAKSIHAECGEEALLHVFDLYNGWANAFHSACSLSPPEFGKAVKLDVDFSADQSPVLVVKKNGTSGDVEWAEGSSAVVVPTAEGDGTTEEGEQRMTTTTTMKMVELITFKHEPTTARPGKKMTTPSSSSLPPTTTAPKSGTNRGAIVAHLLPLLMAALASMVACF